MLLRSLVQGIGIVQYPGAIPTIMQPGEGERTYTIIIVDGDSFQELTALDDLNAANGNGFQTVMGRDGHGTIGRCSIRVVLDLAAVSKIGLINHKSTTGNVHRHGMVCALYGDGQRGLTGIPVSVRDGVGEAFLQGLTFKQVTHNSVLAIKGIRVGAIGVQGNGAVVGFVGIATLRPKSGNIPAHHGHVTHMAVRANDIGIAVLSPIRARAIQHVARALNILALAFPDAVCVVMRFGIVVHDNHCDIASARIPVRIRHGYRQKMREPIVCLALSVLLGGFLQGIGVGEAPRDPVKACDLQHTLIGCNGCVSAVLAPHKLAIGKDSHRPDGDGRNAVRGVDDHAASGNCGRVRGVCPAAVRKTSLVHHKPVHHVAHAAVVGIVGIVYDRRLGIKGFRSAWRDGHAVVHIPVPIGVEIVLGLLAPVEADVQATKTVNASQKSHVAVLVEAAATGGSGSSWACGRHEIGIAQGSEEVLAGDFRALHLEARHLLLRIGRVEIL